MKRTKILGVNIDCCGLGDAIGFLSNKRIKIYTPNPEILLEARSNPEYARILNEGSLMLADGHGLLFVSTLLKIKSGLLRLLLFIPALIAFLLNKRAFNGVIPEVIHGSDFMLLVISWAELTGKSVFFLGSFDHVAKATAQYFKAVHPNLKIAGHSNADPGDEAFQFVKKSGADILFVAYGAPKQEVFIDRYFDQLPDLSLAMGVGGSFDFFSGKVKRAPAFMRALGLEWFWRLLVEPKKRAPRIFKALIVFPLKAIFSSK